MHSFAFSQYLSVTNVGCRSGFARYGPFLCLVVHPEVYRLSICPAALGFPLAHPISFALRSKWITFSDMFSIESPPPCILLTADTSEECCLRCAALQYVFRPLTARNTTAISSANENRPYHVRFMVLRLSATVFHYAFFSSRFFFFLAHPHLDNPTVLEAYRKALSVFFLS